MIAGNRADLLPQALGRLQANMPQEQAAIRAGEADLAAARNLAPFEAMGETYSSALTAALEYGEKVAWAVGEAAHPRNV
jgi:hypothetical protein